jgi:hypothetical protein
VDGLVRAEDDVRVDLPVLDVGKVAELGDGEGLIDGRTRADVVAGGGAGRAEIALAVLGSMGRPSVLGWCSARLRGRLI